jgi:hypothetical protein
MSDTEQDEEKKPFQLRAFPVASRKLAVSCAIKAGLTVPEWVDRAVHSQARIDRQESLFPPGQWEAYRNGTTEQPIAAVDAATSIADMATLLHAAAALAAHTTMPREVRSLISAYARSIRSLETTRKTNGGDVAILQAHDSGASITNP